MWEAHLPAGVDPSRLDLLAHGTLVKAWARRWDEAPGRPALIEPHQARMAYGQLEEASRAVAGRFAADGLAAGDRLIVSAATSVDLVVAYVAALRLGLVVVPVNPAYRERELAHLVSVAEPRAAVTDDPDRGRLLARLSPTLRVYPPSVKGDTRDPQALDRARPDDPALLAFTSGTTGAPKAATLTHGSLLAGIESVILAWRWTAADRLVLALPLFHIHGLGVGLHGTLVAGGSAVLLPRFEPDGVLGAAAATEATMFFGVPTMYVRLAASTRVEELARLRLCVSGSAPLAPDVFAAIAERGRTRVLERYGMTETLMNVSNPYDGERRPGTVGFPLPGVEMRLARGDAGEIWLRGPNVFPGYWRDPAATAAVLDGDGWFRTGDVGEVDADGYLRIVGRTKELIITGGLNVYPREVEEVLEGHPAVAEAAVVGQPDPEWGEVVVAYVVPAGAAPPAGALLAHAAERLARYKQPREVRFVDALPRNALGKILRHELSR